ncbi:ABC transporter ATP-binding protein [Hoeflea sp.]|uniref:ABC transporter ATP-binding protein n=1 Tax=Hoeflea sp. TaxID=1940281 RepID=UPI003BAE6E7E
MTAAPHLVLTDVSKTYTVQRRGLGQPVQRIRAVDTVSLHVNAGETLGLVGESGCGKSSLARLMLRLEEPSGGDITIGGQNIAHLSGPALKQARKQFQMIFQDPYASLNPRMKVRAIIAEAMRNFRLGSAAEIDARVERLAEQVGLSAYHLDRFPHELSGGQCQRIGIARAIALSPQLIVADEPVSALDVSIQAQILNLITRLQSELDLTMVFISHDLSVVSHVADRVAVMYLGRIVETGPTDTIFDRPAHPYTRILLSAVPRALPKFRHARAGVRGELPSPLDPPSGCHFRTRCPLAVDRCASEVPMLREMGNGRQTACHRAEDVLATPSTPATETSHA